MSNTLSLEKSPFEEGLERNFQSVNKPSYWQAMRLKAWQQFQQIGLPTKKDDAYRSLPLRQIFSTKFSPSAQVGTLEKIEDLILPECQNSAIVFINGRYSPHYSRLKNIPSTIFISNLEDAASTYGMLIDNYWRKSLKEEKDPFFLLNSALYEEGAFFYVPPKTESEVPIQLLHILSTEEEDCFISPRLQIFLAPHSNVELIFTQKKFGSSSLFVNQVTEVLLEENARLTYTEIFEDPIDTDQLFYTFKATVKKNSSLKTIVLTDGCKTFRSNYQIQLTGENAEAFLNGLSLLKEKRQAHTNIFMQHLAPHCRSYQLFKAVLSGITKSSFEGKIFVEKEAQKTEAFQLNNNLLLSEYANVNSRPNLEIFADDVKASHGATIGQMDQEQLFYLKTRGFSHSEATNLLIFGFCEEILEMIPLDSLKETAIFKAKNYS